MKQTNRFSYDMLDLEQPDAAKDVFWLSGMAIGGVEEKGNVLLKIPFQVQQQPDFRPDRTKKRKIHSMMVRAYGENIIRCTIGFGGRMPSDQTNEMMEWDPTLKQKPLHLEKTEKGWVLTDSDHVLRMKIPAGTKPIKKWSTLQPDPQYFFDAVVFPDGRTAVPFMANDTFTPLHLDSASLGYVERDGRADRCCFSLHANHDEKFAGTGERFASMNLAGKTFVLENEDALGTNSRRAYKNVPFYLSSKGYGLLIMTSCSVRLSLADISTRAAQGLVEDDILDLFLIGGTRPDRIIYEYRRVTGFPRNVPLWSYGIWMSRMTYFSAQETMEVIRKLRQQKFPCDVIHLDTGWFPKDWQCEWKFNEKTFPDPKKYMKEMKQQGIHISLWQTPNVARNTEVYQTAVKNGYLPVKTEIAKDGSNFGKVQYGGRIDFTNPAAVQWYQGLLRHLFDLGASVIKTDFGEKIDMDGCFYGKSPEELHNLYALLYQKAAFDITEKVMGKGQAIIWARAGWTGCQRYPVHWGGDCASTWDGLAGTIRGGLHLGVSGFGFWSHDIPGFHGLPDFMNHWPENDLYLRWTQVGVFTSHMRYHGASPREPYHYPEIADLVREWWNLRYALIPYLKQQGDQVVKTGFPLMRALLFHHPEDPYCWYIDDEFYCGDSLLVAPVMNPEGKRDVYLPEGRWTDFWTGETISGPVQLKGIVSPLSRIPVYCTSGVTIPVYPEIVQHTGEMDWSKICGLAFDESYKGFSKSILGKNIKLGCDP